MGSMGNLENCDILVEEGKIKKIGKNLEVPENAEVIDADGLLVTPGLVEGHCHVGMWEESVGPAGDDGNEAVDPVTPQLRAIDALNPMDEGFLDALKAGVTTVVTGPGSANVIGGQFAAVKTFGDRIDNMIVKAPVAMKIAFGENPKRVYGGKNVTPSTRMATAAVLRETLFKAKAYMEKKEKAEAEGKDMPEFNMKYEALIPVLKKEIPLKAHAHRADDIFTALRIAKEFDLRITLDHCTEGHLIADELSKEGRGCLVGPTLSNRSKVELKNKSFSTPKVLTEKGLKVGIITDAPVIPQEFLSLCAALAVKEGLPEEDGWKAVTINSAQIVGIDDKVGSLEVGKDADIAIFDKNPLRDVGAVAKYVIVDGKVAHKA